MEENEKGLAEIHDEVFDKFYGYDDKLAQGTWVTLPNGFEVKLAFAHTEKVEAIVQEKRNKLSDKLGRELSSDEHEKIGEEMFCEYLVLGWKAPLECTPANILAMMKKYPKFVTDCMAMCHNNQTFKSKRLDEQTKK